MGIFPRPGKRKCASGTVEPVAVTLPLKRHPNQRLASAMRQRLAECGLELHSEKARIVCCKDATRRQRRENVAFDFLGYTFHVPGRDAHC